MVNGKYNTQTSYDYTKKDILNFQEKESKGDKYYSIKENVSDKN